MNNKILLIGGGVAVVFIVALIIVFATSSGNKKKTNTPSGPVTLNLWTTENEKTAIDPIINRFQQDHANIKINYVVKNPDSFVADSLNEMAAGNGPDIWVIPNDWMPQYFDKMAAVNDAVFENKKQHKTGLEAYREKFPAVVAQDAIIGNKIYGIPLSADTLKIFSNPKILSTVTGELQIANQLDAAKTKILGQGPQNWDEFVQAVKLITKKNGETIDRAAVAMGTGTNVNQSVDIINLLMLQNGTKMVSDDRTTAQFHTDQNVFSGLNFPGSKALEFYTSFANPKSQNYTWDSSMPDSVRAFAEGKVAMMIDYQSSEQDIKRIAPDLQYRTFSMPQIKETKNPINFASYNLYTVPKASKNSGFAWDFILALTTDANNINTYTAISKKTSITQANTNQNDPLKTAQSWFKPDPQKTDTIFKEMITQVHQGTDPQTAIQGAASQITTLLQKIRTN